MQHQCLNKRVLELTCHISWIASDTGDEQWAFCDQLYIACRKRLQGMGLLRPEKKIAGKHKDLPASEKVSREK